MSFRSRSRARPARAPRRAALVSIAALLLPAACGELAWPAARDPALARYRDSFEADVGERFVATSTSEQFVARSRSVDVLWLGDDHRDLALHRRQLDLLQQLRTAGVRLAFGLEAIGTDDEPLVADWQRGGSLTALRRQLRQRWPGSWLDDPDVDHDYYGQLLVDARAAGEPVFALEPTPRAPLAARDEIIAGNVLRGAARHRGRLVVVVVGQSHLLGTGDLIGRVDLPSLAIGAVPPPAAWPHAPTRRPHCLAQTSSGLWFFADLLPTPR
jgi:hypothetical protein